MYSSWIFGVVYRVVQPWPLYNSSSPQITPYSPATSLPLLSPQPLINTNLLASMDLSIMAISYKWNLTMEWNVILCGYVQLLSFFFFKHVYLFVLVVVCSIFSWDTWDLVPWPGIKPGPLQWEHSVLATGLPGEPLASFFEHNVFKSHPWYNMHICSTLLFFMANNILLLECATFVYPFISWWTFRSFLCWGNYE